MNLSLRIKTSLYKVFWIDKFDGKNKMFVLVAKFFMYGYIVSVLMSLIAFIASFDLVYLMFTFIIIVLFPMMYRIIMGIQRYIHKV